MARHASARSVSARAIDSAPNRPGFTPRHCACMPCRFGFRAQHLRRHEVRIGAVAIGKSA